VYPNTCFAENQKAKLRFILKSDVAGSEEAIISSVEALSREDFEVVVIDAQIGPITESDIAKADTFGASILCFNVNIPKQTQDLLDRNDTKFRRFQVCCFLSALLLRAHLPEATMSQFAESC
jgi:translation initiation factor IF-2